MLVLAGIAVMWSIATVSRASLGVSPAIATWIAVATFILMAFVFRRLVSRFLYWWQLTADVK